MLQKGEKNDFQERRKPSGERDRGDQNKKESSEGIVPYILEKLKKPSSSMLAKKRRRHREREQCARSWLLLLRVDRSKEDRPPFIYQGTRKKKESGEREGRAGVP